MSRPESGSRPGPADPAAARYRGESGRAYHHGKRALYPAALPWVAKLRAEKFQPWVRPTDAVLEFGAGAAWNLLELRCARKVACDATDAFEGASRPAGIEFVAELEDLPPGGMDVVIAHHVLEHVLEPVTVLRGLERVLHPAGRLVLHVPWEREKRYARHDPAEPNHHLHTWNAQNVGNLLGVLGWREVSVRARRYGYDRWAANAARRGGWGEGGFRLLRSLLIACRPLWEIEAVALRPGGG